VEGIPLCERFGRLFDLVATKSRTIAEMCGSGWEAGGGVDVEETTVGVEGRVIGEVIGRVSRQVAVAA
jgi:hypothetical protein